MELVRRHPQIVLCLDLHFLWAGIFVREKAGAVAVENVLPGLQTHIQQQCIQGEGPRDHIRHRGVVRGETGEGIGGAADEEIGSGVGQEIGDKCGLRPAFPAAFATVEEG
jgi:hypothetical protein